MKTHEIIKVIVGVVLFAAVITLSTIEYPWFNNTVNALGLTLRTFLVMLVFVALILYYFLPVLDELFEKFLLIMASLMIALILSPMIGSLTNRLLGEDQSQMKSYELIEQNPVNEQFLGLMEGEEVSVDGYRVVVETDDGTESFYIRDKNSVRVEGDKIYLPMVTGGWGYEYLKEQ